ncbi:MAG: hypothetical protein ACYTGX_16045 [Planctomycetota bacterium]|jgi:hypothetical protein
MADGQVQYHAVQTQLPLVGKRWETIGQTHAQAVEAWLATFGAPPEIVSHHHSETSFTADGDMPYLRIVDAFVYRT